MRQTGPAELLDEHGVHAAGVAHDEARQQPGGPFAEHALGRPCEPAAYQFRAALERRRVADPGGRPSGGQHGDHVVPRARKGGPDPSTDRLARCELQPAVGRREQQHGRVQPVPCGAIDQRGDRRVRHHPHCGAAGQHAGLSVQVQDHGGRPAGLGDHAERGVRPRQSANDREPAGDREARQDREEQGGPGPPEGEGGQPGRRDRDPTQQQRSPVGRRELDRPDRRGHGDEAQIHPHPATRASRLFRHRTGRAHTVTSSTSRAAIAGPMPGTSSSWSTLVKGPSVVR